MGLVGRFGTGGRYVALGRWRGIELEEYEPRSWAGSPGPSNLSRAPGGTKTAAVSTPWAETLKASRLATRPPAAASIESQRHLSNHSMRSRRLALCRSIRAHSCDMSPSPDLTLLVLRPLSRPARLPIQPKMGVGEGACLAESGRRLTRRAIGCYRLAALTSENCQNAVGCCRLLRLPVPVEKKKSAKKSDVMPKSLRVSFSQL